MLCMYVCMYACMHACMYLLAVLRTLDTITTILYSRHHLMYCTYTATTQRHYSFVYLTVYFEKNAVLRTLDTITTILYTL